MLKWDRRINRPSSSYLDHILVDERVALTEEVENHLRRRGLVCKSVERVCEGVRVLGMRVWEERDCLFGIETIMLQRYKRR